MKPATIRVKNVVRDAFGTATHAVMELRAGARGTGRVLAATDFWPNAGRSVEAAEDLLLRRAEDEGYEIVPLED